MSSLLAWLFGVALIVLAYLYVRDRSRIKALEDRYGVLIDLDVQRDQRQKEAEKARADLESLERRAREERANLEARYASGVHRFEELTKEIAALEEHVDDLSVGLYKPHFDFHSSEEFKKAIDQARTDQKALVRAGHAASCNVSWEVGGSRREGERMAKQNLKMILRAFNAECDAAIANVAWNNASKMEERIRKSFEMLNDLGTVLRVSISDRYLQLKLRELRLTREHEEKRQEEREEQRRIREQIREEERVEREIARAQEETEKEEARFARALEKARAEAAKASGESLGVLQDKIAGLEEQLRVAHEQHERAVSRAQMTKSGYVYVVSNIGSFGDGVLKVGMTRRLEPYDRILELGDASVPFPFDVHAMLYSDNAPQLERELHEHLQRRRVNLVNFRKEFFVTTLREIQKFAESRGIVVEFTLLAEAKEYRESVAKRAAEAERAVEPIVVPFPTELFPEDRPTVQA